MLHPHFTPDITLGHLVQAGVLIASVAGGIFGGYLELRADLDRQRAEYRVALAGDEARLAVAERLLDERRAEDRQFQTEMRAALDRVMVTLADIRAPNWRKSRTANNRAQRATQINHEDTKNTKGRDGRVFVSFVPSW